MQEKKSNSPVLSFFIFAWFWSLPYRDLWQVRVSLYAYITTPSYLAQVAFEEPKQENTEGILSSSREIN